jgi:hypothetical protein
MNGFNRLFRQASRNVIERWRQLTFAGIVRIPFPVTGPKSTKTDMEYEYTQTEAFFQSVRARIRPGSAPSQP